MKKKVVAAMLAGMIILTPMSRGIKVNATPVTIVDSATQSEYNEKLAKYNELVEKVQVLDNQISNLVTKINDNNTEIDNINEEIENSNKEIEQVKADIKEQEEVLGKRLREIYKSGGQASYISILFSSDSFSDLISKMDNARKLINLDKKIVDELGESKAKLDEKVDNLQTKVKEVEALNVEIKEQKAEADAKKADQQVVLAEAEVEKKTFEKENIAPIEKKYISGWIEEATDNSNSVKELEDVIGALNANLNSLQSQEAVDLTKEAISKAQALINQKKEEAKKPATNRGDVGVTVSGSASNLINYAYNFLGVKYVYGGTTPSGFDCSGFTQYVFRNAAGIGIGRTTYDQIKAGREVSYSELKPGDLVFPHADHVGIYIGNGQMIHAPQTGDVVKIAPVYRFWRARRVLN